LQAAFIRLGNGATMLLVWSPARPGQKLLQGKQELSPLPIYLISGKKEFAPGKTRRAPSSTMAFPITIRNHK